MSKILALPFLLGQFKSVTSSTVGNRCVFGSSSARKLRMRPPAPEGTGPPEYPGPWPGPPSVLLNFFNGLCSTISSCFYIVCCCWLLQDCFGAPPEPPPPIPLAPPQAPPPGPSGPSEPPILPPPAATDPFRRPSSLGGPIEPPGDPPGLPPPY